jgi:plastocyanin
MGDAQKETEMKNLITCLVVTVLSGATFAVAETHYIQAFGNSFIPDSIVVAPGDTIVWEYNSGYPHTVTSGSDCVPDGLFFDEPLDSGSPTLEWIVPDYASLDIPYFCQPHCGMGMTGVISINAGGAILNVPGDYPTIAQAIGAAAPGDIINIAAGTYYEANLTLGAANIALRGEANADGTPAVTIDAQQQGRVFEMVGGGPPPGIAGLVVFDTLIITGGAVNGNGGGVSITNCSPTFLNCTITQNSCTGNGGGVFVYHQGEGAPWTGASPLLIGCTIIGNEAQDGGGMFSSSNGYGAGAQPSLDGCLVTENTASNGVGGIRHATSPGQTTVINSIICGNVPSQIAGSVILDANSCSELTCVDDDGDGLPDSCQGDTDGILHVPDEYATILIALQNASDGNTIAIAAGTYLLEGNGLEFTNGISLSIIGDTNVDGTPAVLLDGQLSGAYGITLANGTGQTVIENIHIVGCQVPLFVVNCSVLLTNCIIENNSSGHSTVILSNCVATLNACSVIGNSGTFGGGIMVIDIDEDGPSSEVSLIDCVIEDNYGAYPGYAVGGIGLNSGHTTITNCTVKNNFGGGIGGVGILADATATMADTTVCGNVGYKGNTTQISGDYTDGGGNTIEDVCPVDCPADINGDGAVDITDLLGLIGAWGACDGCPEDIDGSGAVDITDLLTVIGAWGDCE